MADETAASSDVGEAAETNASPPAERPDDKSSVANGTDGDAPAASKSMAAPESSSEQPVPADKKEASGRPNAAPATPETGEPAGAAPASGGDEDGKKNTETTTNSGDTAAKDKDDGDKNNNTAGTAAAATPTSAKKPRPQFKYDPNKITLRFLFANRDGLTVQVECNPSDTIGEVKGALISVWPEDMPQSGGGENIRLICMGKGYLMPDTRTLDDCQVPVFKTHPTPINVSVKPDVNALDDNNKRNKGGDGSGGGSGGGAGGSGGGPSSDSAANAATASQGCACAIL